MSVTSAKKARFDTLIERALTPFQSASDIGVRVRPPLSLHDWEKLWPTAERRKQKAKAEAPAGQESHYTPEELGSAWHLSANTIRRMFRNEPGVLRITRPEKMHKRGYHTMRIPKSVADRVRMRAK